MLTERKLEERKLRKEVTLIPTKIQKQIESLTKGGYRG